MAVYADTRNLQKTNLVAPSFKDMSTGIDVVHSMEDWRLHNGDMFFWGEEQSAIADASSYGALFQLPDTATCAADVLLSWKATADCLVQLYDAVTYVAEAIGVPTDAEPKRRLLTQNFPQFRIDGTSGGSISGGSVIFEDITGTSGGLSGSFRFMPERMTAVASGNNTAYWLKITNRSGSPCSIAARADWTEWEEIR